MLQILLFVCCVPALTAASFQRIDAVRGSNATFKCTLNGTFSFPEWQGPPSHTIYTVQGDPIPNPAVPDVNDRRLIWDGNNSYMILRNVSYTDAGDYMCIFQGLGIFKFKLNVTDPVEVNSDKNTIKIVVAVGVILFWIILCTAFLCIVRRKATVLKGPFSQVVIIMAFCYIVFGWCYVLHKFLGDASSSTNDASQPTGSKKTIFRTIEERIPLMKKFLSGEDRTNETQLQNTPALETSVNGSFATDPQKGSIYLKALLRGKENSKHVCIVMVGNSGYDKFSLAKCLLNKNVEDQDTTEENFVGNDVTTEIAFYAKEIFDSNRKEYAISILDVYGHLKFYTMQHMFYSKNTIYFVVINISKCVEAFKKPNENNAELQELRFWGRAVQSFLGDEQELPIYFIITKNDSSLDITNLTQSLLPEIDPNNISSPIIVDTFLPHDKGVEVLFTAIAQKVEQFGNILPLGWIAVRNKIIHYKGDPIVHTAHFKDLFGIQMEDDEIKSFLHYCHQTGIIIYFDEANLSNVIILKPIHLMNAFGTIIAKQLGFTDSKLKTYYNRLVLEGCLEEKFLPHIWSKKPEFCSNLTTLINFLERFHLISRTLRSKSANKKSYFPFYIVPCLLTARLMHNDHKTFIKEGIENIESKISYIDIAKVVGCKRHSLGSLIFTFKFEMTAQFAYHSLTAAAVGTWPIIEYKNKLMLCNYVGVYKISEQNVGVILYKKNVVELMLMNTHKDAANAMYGDIFRRFVEMTLKQKLGRGDISKQCFYLSIRLLSESLQADGNGKECPIIQLTNYDTAIGSANITQPDMVKEAIKEWFLGYFNIHSASKVPLTEDICSKFALGINGNLEILARSHLKLTQEQVEQIQQDYSQSTTIQIFQMLLQWQKNNTSYAHVDTLLNALKSCKEIEVDWELVRNILDDF